MKVWNVETGEQRKSVAATAGQVNATAAVGLEPKVAISTSKSQCQVLDENGKVLKSFAGANGYVYTVAVTADGKQVAASGEDGILRIWNVADGAVTREFKP